MAKRAEYFGNEGPPPVGEMTHRPDRPAGWVPFPELLSGGHTPDEFRVRRGVKALVTTPRRLLLVRERHADGTPFWTLPGGGAHQGEPIAATARRELMEELRSRCRVHGTVDSFWYVHHSIYQTVSVYTVRRCTLLGEPSPAVGEIHDAQWFRPSDLPPRTLPGVVASLDKALQYSRGARCVS